MIVWAGDHCGLRTCKNENKNTLGRSRGGIFSRSPQQSTKYSEIHSARKERKRKKEKSNVASKAFALIASSRESACIIC